MIAKIIFVSLLGALVVLFLPWIELRCSSEPMLTQTGIQIVYGGGTPVGAFAEMADERADSPADAKRPDSAGASVLVGAAAFATVLALVFAFVALRHDRPTPLLRSGALATVALAAILAQLAIGFPVQDQINNHGDPDANPFAKLASAAMKVEVVPRPALYIELAALGLPVLIFGNAVLDRLRRT